MTFASLEEFLAYVHAGDRITMPDNGYMVGKVLRDPNSGVLHCMGYSIERLYEQWPMVTVTRYQYQ